MTIPTDELRAYAAGLADDETSTRIERELQANPDGESARYLRRLDRLLADPWRIDWRGVAAAVEPPEDSSERIRQELAVLVAEVGTGRRPGLSLNDIRGLVNEVRARLDVAGFPVPPETYYLLAGAALRDLAVERARRRAGGTSAAETHAGTTTTLHAAALDPVGALETDRRLAELETVDSDLQKVFILAHFAGRTPDEIAQLTGLPVEDKLPLARAHVGAGRR